MKKSVIIVSRVIFREQVVGIGWMYKTRRK